MATVSVVASTFNGGWMNDAQTSPCLDAGDPKSSVALEPHLNGGRINLGRYGNTPEASKTPEPTGAVMVVR